MHLNKLEWSEELGDLVKTVDADLALNIYIKDRATLKVVVAFAKRREFDKILIYSKQINQHNIMFETGWISFCKPFFWQISRELLSLPLCCLKWREVILPVDYNTIIDLFLQVNMIRETMTFLLDVLKPNLPEHAFLQTKVLEINLVTFPNVANAILENGMFSHYDRPHITQLYEEVGLYVRALQHLWSFWDTFQGMGYGVSEGSFTGQFKRKSADNCSESSLESKPTSEDPHDDD
ncbi:hypothetical protein OROMI_001396 [Orobanche minor]